MSKFKKIISLVLTVCMLASIVSVAAVSVSANAGDEKHRQLITDVVNSEDSVDTNTYYFYLPKAWRNEYNDYYNYNAETKTFDGEGGNFAAGIYWWEGPYNCEDYKGDFDKGWIGYAVNETLAEDSNIFKANVPKDAGKFIWNNLVDCDPNKKDSVFYAATQTEDIGNEYYDPGEDGYGFYPDGINSFDGMIYVCDIKATEENVITPGKFTFKGAWFYYYGNGEYSFYKTREEAQAHNAVYKNGQFPRLEGGEPESVPEITLPKFTEAPTEETTEPVTESQEVTEATQPYSQDETEVTEPYSQEETQSYSEEETESEPYYEDKDQNVLDDFGYYFNDGYAIIYSYYGYDSNVVIPDTIEGNSVKSIDENAFYSCQNLKSITIPDSVNYIGYQAFYGCTNLKKINLPDSVITIDPQAFEYTAYYDDENNWENKVLYIGKHLIEAKDSLNGSYSIKNGTLTIVGSAFSDCKNLTDITIPDSVTKIGQGAFSDCTGLTSITVPDGVTSIGYSTFYNCKNLKNIDLPDSIVTIEINAFKYTAYYNDESNWENGVLYIGKYLIEAYNMSGTYSIKPGTILIAEDAFAEEHWGDNDWEVTYSELEKVIIPDSVKYIGEEAFWMCEKLESITIPDSVVTIGNAAFASCPLSKVTIPASVVDIGDYAFGYYSGGQEFIPSKGSESFYIYGYRNSDAERYSLDNGFIFVDVVTGEEIKHHFDYKVLDDGTAEITGYKGIYSKIEIPSIIDGYKVTSIGEHAFEPGENDDDYLLFLSIPDTVTNIGEGAFYGLSYNFSIPESVKSIGDKAFGYYYVEDDGEHKNDGMFIFGTDDSAAQKYAKDNGFNFCDFSDLNNVSETITIKKGESIDFDDTNAEDYAILDRSIARFRGSAILIDPVTGEILDNKRIRIEALEVGTTKLIIKYKDNPSYVVKEIKVIDGGNPDPVVTEPVTNPVVTDPTQPSNPKPTTPKVTTKKNNPIKVSVKTKTVKLKKLKKKAQKVKAITVKNNQGKVTFKLVKSGITKKIRKLVKINSKGVITIKKWKKAKKGTYKIKVKVTAAGNSNYNAKTITKTVKVKVK